MYQPKNKDNPRATNSNVRKVIRLWFAFNFFVAPIRDGLNPFISVYLVTVAGLSPGIAGLIWFIRDMAMFFSQVPFGVLVDSSANKKCIIFLCTSVCIFTPMAIIWSNNVPILIVKTILEGIASSGLAVVKGPFTLGISGHELFHTTTKYTEIAEHTGAFFSALLAGCVAYVFFHKAALLFSVIGVFGFLACVCILLMPTHSTPSKDGSFFIIVNNDLARNSEDFHETTVEDNESNDNELKNDQSRLTTVEDNESNNDGLARNYKESNEITIRDNESNDNAFKDDIFEDNVKAIEDNEKFTEGNESKNEELENGEPISIWKIMSDRNIAYFALGIFFFHLGNAAILPLLGQAIALKSGRAGIPYTAANIVVAQISSVGAAYMMDYAMTKGVQVNTPIQVGFGSQALRIGIIITLTSFWPNPYALVATQLLDGIGAGVNGMATMQITMVLTKGTNKFGLIFSIVNLCGFCGGALSNLISGFIVTATSYRIGFVFLLCPIALSMVFICLLEVQSNPDQCADKEKDQKEIPLSTASDVELDPEDTEAGIQIISQNSLLSSVLMSTILPEQTRRSSINVASMYRASIVLPQAERRASINAASVSRKRRSSISNILGNYSESREITFNQVTNGRRLSSVEMKYE